MHFAMFFLESGLTVDCYIVYNEYDKEVATFPLWLNALFNRIFYVSKIKFINRLIVLFYTFRISLNFQYLIYRAE